MGRISDEASVLAPGDVLSDAAPAMPDATLAVLGSSYAFIETIHEKDSATSEPWTPAAINAVQAGLEVAT